MYFIYHLKAHTLAESISSGVRSHRFSERSPLLFGLSPWASHGRRVNQLQEWHRYSERTPYLGYFARSIVALRAHTLAESISRGGVRSHRFSERTPSLFSLSPWSLTWLPSWSVTGGILSRANMYNEHTQNVRAGHTLFLMTYLSEFVNQYVMYQIGVLK